MSEGKQASLLARKAGRARPGRDGERSPWGKAWRVVVPRVTDEALGVEARLLTARQRREELKEILANSEDTGLFLRLQGPGAGVGVAHLDGGFLAALIEAMTVGRVLQADAAQRMGTKTDAAIVGPVIDRLLAAAAGEAGEDGPGPPWAGFTVAGRFTDRRAAELQVDDGPTDCAGIEVEFAGGLKSGRLTLALRTEDAEAAAGAERENRAGFTESVMDTRACIAVVLDRPRVPIGWVRGLAPGQNLGISRDRLADARVETTGGVLLARGRLGQAAGQRAVRLTVGSGLPGRPVAVDVRESLPGAGSGGAPGPGKALSGRDALLAGLPDLPDLPPPADTPADPGERPFPDLPELPDLPTAE